jgi:hypothetical protein
MLNQAFGLYLYSLRGKIGCLAKQRLSFLAVDETRILCIAAMLAGERLVSFTIKVTLTVKVTLRDRLSGLLFSKDD